MEYDFMSFKKENQKLQMTWIKVFNKLGIRWQWKTDNRFVDEDDEDDLFVPDFFLPDLHCYFMVTDEDDYEFYEDICTDKFDCAGIIAFGYPNDNKMVLFCQDVSEDSAGFYNGLVTFAEKDRKIYLYAYEDSRERDFYPSIDDGEEGEWFQPAPIPVLTLYDCKNYDKIVTNLIKTAMGIA